jgi:hypothetical protein
MYLLFTIHTVNNNSRQTVYASTTRKKLTTMLGGFAYPPTAWRIMRVGDGWCDGSGPDVHKHILSPTGGEFAGIIY